MFKKSLTVTVAALTLTGATLTATSSAQAGFFGNVAAGVAGVVVGAAVVSAATAPRPVYGYSPAYQPVVYGGCGFRKAPIFDQFGNHVGFRRVPAC